MRFNFKKYHPITGFLMSEEKEMSFEAIKANRIKAENLEKEKELLYFQSIERKEQKKEKKKEEKKKKLKEKVKKYKTNNLECNKKNNIQKMMQYQKNQRTKIN